ncbi:universal stress protein [Pseudorhodoferax sp.]|uniref:universal stress protein n=1 Tax=Pseudorhodoferax sp. TaxID=1993553 RepID=UPI002DD6401E|nr:universal stress protein [Pseudorhodoferax sp.]
MTEAMRQPVLLATDLSPRSDRALDRALLLARSWRVPLVALTVVPTGAGLVTHPVLALSSDAVAQRAARRQAERRLRADLADATVPPIVHVEQGEVTSTVLAVAQAERCGLIVTGVARHEALARMLLGSTVETLARRAPLPLLVVRERARQGYTQVLVTTDFSEHARHALQTAAALFPEAAFTVFHAFGNPYPLLAGMDVEQVRQAGRAAAEEQARLFLDATPLPTAVRAGIRLRLAYGDPGLLLREHGAEHPGELVVLGTQRRSGLTGLLLGSVAERVLELAQSDVLVVPPQSSA